MKTIATSTCHPLPEARSNNYRAECGCSSALRLSAVAISRMDPRNRGIENIAPVDVAGKSFAEECRTTEDGEECRLVWPALAVPVLGGTVQSGVWLNSVRALSTSSFRVPSAPKIASDISRSSSSPISARLASGQSASMPTPASQSMVMNTECGGLHTFGQARSVSSRSEPGRRGEAQPPGSG